MVIYVIYQIWDSRDGQKIDEEEEEFILENQAQTFTVMAVDIANIEINNYNIQNNLCSYWLSRGDPEGKKIPLLDPLNTWQYPVHDSTHKE